MNEKVNNNLLYGYVTVMIVFVVLTVVFALVEIKSLCIISLLVFLTELILLLTSPRYYVFSKEKVVIKYFFGLEENILWCNLRAVTSAHESFIFRYRYTQWYHLIYYTEKKNLSFMQGKVNKNKKTEHLMNKYCPQKIN